MTVHPDAPLVPGTAPWFAMVGAVLCETADDVGLPADLTISLVERYTDGEPWSDGLVQGLRLDVVRGRATVRVGVAPDETGDVTILVTAAAARRLNAFRSSDPEYDRVRAALVGSGELSVEGDPSPVAEVLARAHDPIVERTDQDHRDGHG